MKLKLFFIFSTIFISSCITFKKGEPRTLSKLILPTSYDDGYCENPPEGMVCIPGGNFKSERLDNAEKVDTFYIDKYEITNADYTKCVEEKGCPANKSIKSKEFENLNGDNQPAVPLSFEMAYSYCKWNGKRLPTELEWEKTFNY
ncbi:MAG: SUMF1/EgtB/PvdO family nonheme iron enzyme, partial [Leptospiraceae bacterium]|nr:SUMF1/EgtB/PvdO family nonheme iron enzyme [Leptospiraceae bacterium]